MAATGKAWTRRISADWQRPFWQRGLSLTSINYRLAPQARLADICANVTAAIDHLQGHAVSLDLEPGDFALVGHSAGGHLVMQELVRERRALARGEITETRTAALCALSEVYDLEPLRRSYQQTIVSLDAREVSELNPLRNAPGSAPPVLVAVGDRETPEFVRQQNALVAQWQALELPIEGQRVAGRDRFSVADALAEEAHTLRAG